MSFFATTAAWLVLFCVAPAVASAASLYLQVPGIVGEQSTPGYPGSMEIQSLQITPNHFAITKSIDLASPQITNAVAKGTVFPSASALLYDSNPMGPPDSALVFQNVVASSYQIQGGGTTELDGFVATNPISMFLELPGIIGASSTPGHPGVMQLSSFSLTANQFSITKALDSASPQLVLAVADGTEFDTASALFYNTAVPPGAPDGIFGFERVVASAYQIVQGGEQVTFNFVHVPEPAISTLFGCGALFWLAAGRRLIQNAKPKLK